MTHLQEHWEGVCLCGNYTLERWLGRDDDGAAFFQTSLGPGGRSAVAKLAPEAGGNGAGPLYLWHRIRQLRHPNLVELLDCGRADLDGEIVFYAIFESPDDTLASALSRGPLNQEEAREVLDSVIDALRYLHAQGLAAGALDPDHIVAVGEKVKLSTGALREAETSSAYREDVRLLGELWQGALMPASLKSAEIALHAADPNAETRWTLAEISSALAVGDQEAPVPALPPSAPPLSAPPLSAPPLPAPPLAVESQGFAQPIPEAPVSETPVAPIAAAPVFETPVFAAPASLPEAVVRNATHSEQTFHRRAPQPAGSSGFPKWIIGAAAGMVFLVLGLHWLHPAKVATPSSVTSVPLPVEAAAPEPLPTTAPPKPAVHTRPKTFSADEQKIWRVIAFTYRTREAAAKKAQQLNEYHAGIDAAVFQPKEEAHYYLVSLGGRMTREEAERLQRSARGRGLPRDLYLQNYTR